MGEIPRSQSVFVMDGAPKGWLQKYKEAKCPILPSTDKFAMAQEAMAKQTESWTDVTGRSPQEVPMMIVLPIHNEANLVPSSLGAVLLGNLPRDLNATLVLVANNCKDNSVDKIRVLLGDFSEDPAHLKFKIQSERLTSLDKVVLTAKIGSINVVVIETPIGGKARNLNMVNRMAVDNKCQLAISVDSDTFVNPDAISLLVAEAYQNHIENPETQILISGSGMSVTRPYNGGRLLVIGPNEGAKATIPEGALFGALNAWNPVFLENLGGFPEVLFEDYALALKLRSRGGRIVHRNDSETWFFSPSNRLDAIKGARRWFKGGVQLRNRFPEYRELIEQDFKDFEPVVERWRRFFRETDANIVKFPFHLGRFMYWELLRSWASLDYMLDPDAKRWDAIESTK